MKPSEIFRTAYDDGWRAAFAYLARVIDTSPGPLPPTGARGVPDDYDNRKELPKFSLDHPGHDSRCTATYCVELDPNVRHSKVRQAIEMGMIDPNAPWVKQQWARVPVSVEAFDRLNNQVIRHEGQLEALEKVAHAPQDVPKLEAHLMLERRIEALEREQQTWDDDMAAYEAWKAARLEWEAGQHARVTSLEERFEDASKQMTHAAELVGVVHGAIMGIPERIQSLERVNDECIANAVTLHAEKDERLKALEQFATEQDRIVGKHESELSLALSQLRWFEARLAKLEAYEADRDKADPPIDATAGMWCEGCGRATTPGGQLRHGYRPDGSIGYDGLAKAPESDDPALSAHCAKLERRAALAQSLNPYAFDPAKHVDPTLQPGHISIDGKPVKLSDE